MEEFAQVSFYEDDKKSSKEEAIRRANSFPLKSLFAKYNIYTDDYNKIIKCPFKTHKGGMESSASFYFYPETNTFHCFGCGKTGGPVAFYSFIEEVSFKEAFKKIINAVGNHETLQSSSIDFKEKYSILKEFSDVVRKFRSFNLSEDDFIFIENICYSFDQICIKYNLSNEKLRNVIKKLQQKIEDYEWQKL